ALFVAEGGVVVRDARHAPGDNLVIRPRPPVGFWALNSFAVDYGPDQTPIVEKVRPLKAWDDGHRDLLTRLSKTDDAYYAMPNVGDRAWVEFPASPTRPGMERTVFLHSRGYYKLHLTGNGKPDLATLQQIRDVPDAAARFAVKRYGEGRAKRASRGWTKRRRRQEMSCWLSRRASPRAELIIEAGNRRAMYRQ